MALLNIYKYQYDGIGTNPNNLVVEDRTLAASDPTVFVPFEGLFYGKSLVITKNGTPLVEGTDYELEAQEPFLTYKTGQPIFAGIKRLTAAMLGGIRLSYQCVGGPEGVANSFVKDLKEAIEDAIANPTINFSDIKGFPPVIQPVRHKHFPSDLEDLDLLAHKFDRFIDAISAVRFYKDSNHNLHSEILNLAAMVGSLRNSLNRQAAITGFVEDIERIEELALNYSRRMDKQGFINTGLTANVLEANIQSFTVLTAQTVLKTTTGVQSVEYTVITDGVNSTIVPKESTVQGTPIITNFQTQFVVTDVGNNLNIAFTAASDTQYKTKILTII